MSLSSHVFTLPVRQRVHPWGGNSFIYLYVCIAWLHCCEASKPGELWMWNGDCSIVNWPRDRHHWKDESSLVSRVIPVARVRDITLLYAVLSVLFRDTLWPWTHRVAEGELEVLFFLLIPGCAEVRAGHHHDALLKPASPMPCAVCVLRVRPQCTGLWDKVPVGSCT